MQSKPSQDAPSTTVLENENNAASPTLNTGLLNELLRAQLTPSQPKNTVTTTQTQTETNTAPKNLTDAAVAAMEQILTCTTFDRTELHDRLSQLFYQQKHIYQSTPISQEARKRQFISRSGLILSPDNCITTVLDDLRMNAFVRGLDQAIAEMTAHREQPLHVVYPACGPFAPLLMPLVGYYREKGLFSPEQLQITFIDIQEGAVATLKQLINELAISEYVKEIVCGDVLDYTPTPASIDLVVLEAMQHGFSREGQLAIARHLAHFVSTQGHFIPQKVSINAVITSCQREYVDQWQESKMVSESDMDDSIRNERILLGEVLSITPDSLRDLTIRQLDQNTALVECNRFQIPVLERQSEQTLLFCSQVQVWNDEYLGEYDSGITHPLPDNQVCINFAPKEPRAGDLLVKSGDWIQFFYRLNGLPGFMTTLTQSGG